MGEVYMDDYSDLYSSLLETIDIARTNILKAFLQAIVGMMVIAFVVLLDHSTLGGLANLALGYGDEKALIALKYFIIFGAAFYVAIATSYIFKSKSHIHEARFLLERLDS